MLIVKLRVDYEDIVDYKLLLLIIKTNVDYKNTYW